jgi:hypothetical protein
MIAELLGGNSVGTLSCHGSSVLLQSMPLSRSTRTIGSVREVEQAHYAEQRKEHYKARQ